MSFGLFVEGQHTIEEDWFSRPKILGVKKKRGGMLTPFKPEFESEQWSATEVSAFELHTRIYEYEYM